MKSLTVFTLLALLLALPAAQAADGTMEGATPSFSTSAPKPGVTIRETDDTYALTAFESVSLSQTQSWQDNRLRAYYSSGLGNVNGFLLFDVTQIPDNAIVTGMTLHCNLENAYSSPYSNPVVDVYYSGDDNWTRSTAAPGSLSLDALLADNVPFTTYVPTYDFTLNVAAHDWSVDLQDNRICIGLKDDVITYSYVYFIGAYGSPTGPAPVLTITTATGTLNPTITMTPTAPPIVVPQQGGSFQFDASVVNNGSQMPFTVWARIKNPDGTYTAPTLGPVTVNPPVGQIVTRNRLQTIPGTWMAGLYYYIGYANTSVSYPAADADSFSFTKSNTMDGGPMVWEATCSGELFPGEVPVSTPASFGVAKVSPNPFNPTTTISFSLPSTQHVTLNVYDMSGRLVTTLVNGVREAGLQQVTFDGSNLASGIYLYTLTAGQNTATGKMVLMK